MEEIEVKFLEVVVPELEQKLVQIGAEKVFDRIFKRCVYDYQDRRLDLGMYRRVSGDFRVDKDAGLDFDNYSEVTFRELRKKDS